MSEHCRNPNLEAAPQPPKPTLAAALRRPGHAARVAIALARGHWHRLYYRLRGIRFRAGRNLRLFAPLSVRGPGEIILGDNVVILETPTFWTYSREAKIVVGDNTIMGATSFGCVKEIRIGRRCIIARASLIDTDFHSTRVDRWMPDAPVRVAPIVIGDNVWISQHAGIMPGTRIGHNSVVSFGAVCMRDFPENVIIVGNPARVASPVQQRPADAPPFDPASAAYDPSLAMHAVAAGGAALAATAAAAADSISRMA